MLGAVSILGLDPSSSQRPVPNSSFEIIFQNSKPAVWVPGNWHYSYQDFRILDFFRVEGYAFKCLRFCKFLLSQTLNTQKGCTFLCVRCHFYGAWCVDGVFFLSMHSFQVCIPQVLTNLVSSYALFIPLAKARACLFCCCCHK